MTIVHLHTSNTHYALSHRGIAREIAAISGSKLKIPMEVVKATSKGKDVVKVQLDGKGGCTRYIAGTMKNLTVGPSPKWLADYLKSVGQKSINNLVDISNFMLLEIGHPTHVFDLNKLSKPTIEVKWAKKDENFHALDEVGEKEVEDSTLTIRRRFIKQQQTVSIEDFSKEILDEINDRRVPN